MVLIVDAVPALRARAKEMINRRFQERAHAEAHFDAAYPRKRQIATDVLAGNPAADDFAEEAGLRGVTVQALASLVLAKPDHIGAREADRMRSLAAVDTMSHDDLKKIFKIAGNSN
jgi:hypothetical protein